LLILPQYRQRHTQATEMNAEQMNAFVANIADHEEDHSSAVAEVAVAPKPQPKKRQLKQMKPIKVSRSPSPIAQVAEEAPQVAEEKTLAEIVAELSNIAQAQEQRIAKLEAEKSDAPPKPKGYYQVADGEEELFRTRIQNANLRKEIEAKTKTNQTLQQQLEEDPNELTRLQAINKGLRKENEGLTNTNKSLKAQLADSTPELTRQKEINATLRKEAEAERRLKLQYKTEKTVMMSQIEKYLAILASNGIVVEED